MLQLKRSAVILALSAPLIVFATAGTAFASNYTLYEADGTTAAPVGTTFDAKSLSSAPVQLENSVFTVDCAMDVPGRVTDNGTSTGTPTANISPTFSGCSSNLGSATVNGNDEPWVLQMPTTGNPGTFTGVDMTMVLGGFITCEYHETDSDQITGTWTNGSPSSITLNGNLAYEAGDGTGWCGSTWSISGALHVDSTSTPGDNLEILPAP